MQAVTGLWSTQGARGGAYEGYRHATQIDAVTGNLLAEAALLGLYQRKRTGEGQYIEVTMLDAGATLQLPRIVEHFAGVDHQPQGSSAFGTAPDRAFCCEDAQWLGVSVTSEEKWRRLCGAVDRPDLEDDARFVTNRARVAHRDELEGILADVFSTKPRSYWELTLTRADVPWGARSRWEELRYHQQVLANDYLLEVDADPWGHVWTGGPPWRFSRTPAHVAGPPIPGIDTWVIKDELESRKAASS
jgi:crotonobetainyl-CoA:carnitine CoA-transferase CaiB-like acyl-CoA transferase